MYKYIYMYVYIRIYVHISASISSLTRIALIVLQALLLAMMTISAAIIFDIHGWIDR